MKYRADLEKTDEGYAVWCPGLPGCWSQGTTEEEALTNIKDAIETYLLTVEELNKGKVTRLVEVRREPCQSCPGSPINERSKPSRRRDSGLSDRASTLR